MVMDRLMYEPLTDIQKKQYMTELGLEPILAYYNKEILKHGHMCFKNLEIRVKRNRIFKLMREEEKELSYHNWQ